jgi:phospholipid/cholesterol/gamma-HCH transport system substrate-binding protein
LKREIKIGLTLLTALAIGYLFVSWAKSAHLFAPDQQERQLIFDNVNGLQAGDPVSIRGYQSGKVTRVEPTSSQVLVKISLDRSIPIFQGATAEVRLKELMGGKMIELFPGLPPKLLPVDESIPGKTSLDISSAFSKFGDVSNSIDMERINQAFVNLEIITTAFAEILKEVKPDDVNALMKNLTASSEKLNRIVGEIEKRQLIGKAETTLTTVNDFLTESQTAFDQITRMADAVETRTLPRTDSLLLQLSQTLEETGEVMGSVESMLDQLKDPGSVAGKALYDPQFVADLDSTISNLNKTLEYIRTRKLRVQMSLRKKNEPVKD